MRIQVAIVIVIVTQGLAGCDSSSSPATSPSSVPSTNSSGTAGLVVFTDSTSGFSTTDLRDAEDEVMQLSTAGELIFPATNTRLSGFRPLSGPEQGINGNICRPYCAFVVRFGSKDGERRAYLTVDYGHDNPGTIVDVEVSGDALVVKQTDLYPPGSPTLSGVVTEATAAGPRPVEGVIVYRGVITGWRQGTTDSHGFYEIRGLLIGVDSIETRKDGYVDSNSQLAMSGDTRLDLTIVRR